MSAGWLLGFVRLMRHALGSQLTARPTRSSRVTSAGVLLGPATMRKCALEAPLTALRMSRSQLAPAAGLLGLVWLAPRAGVTASRCGATLPSSNTTVVCATGRPQPPSTHQQCQQQNLSSLPGWWTPPLHTNTRCARSRRRLLAPLWRLARLPCALQGWSVHTAAQPCRLLPPAHARRQPPPCRWQ